MSRNIVPRTDKGSDLGTAIKKWRTVYSDTVNTNTIILSNDNLQALLDGKVNLNTLMAKGDLYAATGPGRIARLPAGPDGQVLKTNSAAPQGLMWGPAGARQELTDRITVTVGNAGDYNTINEALESITALYYPIYKSGGLCPTVTINLKSGFVMNEQVLVESLDLSWIRITGEDPVTTIHRSALSNRLRPGSMYPAFGAVYGGFLPVINQLFDMDDSGDSTERHGVVAYLNSRAIVDSQCGITNAGANGIYACSSSIIQAGSSANFSGAGENGVLAVGNSIVEAIGINVSGAMNYGVNARHNSMIDAFALQATGVNNYGVQAEHSSIVNANHGNISEAGITGVFARYGSIICANWADISESGTYNIYAADGSRIDATAANVVSSSKELIYNLYVFGGSIINIRGVSAAELELSQDPNVITGNGIIFIS